LSRNIKFY